MKLIEEVGLFPAEELGALAVLLDDYFDRGQESGQRWVVDDDHGFLGAAYYAPERMTEGTWNLYLIGVHPDHRGEGRGSALVAYVEEQLASQGQRILLIETSGLASFDKTRSFYARCGYEAEARIRDFYKAGEDKIVFRKVLARRRSLSC